MASSAQAKKFIAEISPIIQAEAKKRGYKVCSPIIAQACIESAYGTSSLAYKYHNYFGMKCGSSWKGKSVNLSTKEEYQPGVLSTIKDNFRVYDNMTEGVKGYFDFISTRRYENLKTASTPKEYLERIKSDGYATSSTYVNTNMNCISKWNLTQYDGDTPAENPYKLTDTNLKRGSSGESVKWLQWELNRRGYLVGNIDGIFGAKTEQGVKLFQTNTFVDGVVGPTTISALKK